MKIMNDSNTFNFNGKYAWIPFSFDLSYPDIRIIIFYKFSEKTKLSIKSINCQKFTTIC